MQKLMMVCNKVTQVANYLEQRGIASVESELRSLAEIDLESIPIIDVDVLLYIYYAGEGDKDGDQGFRSDLNRLRILLESAFFNVDTATFILVDSTNPMLEDFIHVGVRDSKLVGNKLVIVHHEGMLTLNDVTKYLLGREIGEDTGSSYKTVYIREAESEEKERFENKSDGLDYILPELVDQYSMYAQRAKMEGLTTGRIVSDRIARPIMKSAFDKLVKPVTRQWQAFLFSGEEYTEYEKSLDYFLDYYSRLGTRILVVDLTSDKVSKVKRDNMAMIVMSDLAKVKAFEEKTGYIRCRFNQFGYLLEMLHNVVNVEEYLFFCDKADYTDVQSFLIPICSKLYSCFVAHFTQQAIENYLQAGMKSTTLFLTGAVMYEEFKLSQYKERFIGTRVARFDQKQIDVVEFYDVSMGR